MAKAKAPRRKRREAHPARKEPNLLAFLICERVDTAPDGVQTLVRIFDRTALGAQIVAPPEEELPPLQAPYEFTLFTRFGGGMGTFKHWFKICSPSGEEQDGPETDFWLRDPGKAHNIMTRMRAIISEPGRYWIVCYLDGRETARIPWNVEINIQRIARPGA